MAIGKLIAHDFSYVERFAEDLEKLVEDKSAAIQSCAAYVWRVIATGDYKYAFDMFQRSRRVISSLINSQYGLELIHAGLSDHFSLVWPVVEEMFESEDSETQSAAARMACIAALRHPEAETLATRAVTGNDEQRLQAARVAASNVTVSEFRPWCEPRLLLFFDDPDERVRRVAADCFRNLKDEPLESFGGLIEAYCSSQAYESNSFPLIHTLVESVELLPGIVCMACEQFLKRFGREASDIRTHRAADGYRIPNLAFRVYHQHQRNEWASRALDVIDQLCEQGVGETFSELNAYDR